MSSLLLVSFDHYDRKYRKPGSHLAAKIKVAFSEEECALRNPTCVAIQGKKIIIGGEDQAPILIQDLQSLVAVPQLKNKSRNFIINYLEFNGDRLFFCSDGKIKILKQNQDENSEWQTIANDFLDCFKSGPKCHFWNHCCNVFLSDMNIYYLDRYNKVIMKDVRELIDRGILCKSKVIVPNVACFTVSKSGTLLIATNDGLVSKYGRETSVSLRDAENPDTFPTAIETDTGIVTVASFDMTSSLIVLHLLTSKLKIRSKFARKSHNSLDVVLNMKLFDTKGKFSIKVLAAMYHGGYLDLLAVHRFKFHPILIKCQKADQFNYGMIWNCRQSTLIICTNNSGRALAKIKISS